MAPPRPAAPPPAAAPSSDAAPLGRAFASHDHDACVADALRAAEDACARRGAQLTPVRRRALEILLESHAAMGAYDLLQRLAAEGLGSQPPVAYRALSFLVAQGLAHRIEGLQAFVACARPGAAHVPSFLVCRRCRAVAEAVMEAAAEPGAESDAGSGAGLGMGLGAGPLAPAAAAQGFAIERTVMEAEGLCPACQGARDGAPERTAARP